jgi:outer membrane protein TolC
MFLTRKILVVAATTACLSAIGQTSSVTLEQCRQLALENNKELMMSRLKIDKARYQNKQAFAAYLPALDFNGGYTYNQKEISMFSSDQYLPVKEFDLATQSYQYKLVTNPVTGEPIKTADGQYIPAEVAYLPKEALTYDIHNVFFGALTLTQPIYMGGKIVAMNKLTKYAEEAARELHNSEAENVIYSVDAAYWQVVSLKAKRELAVSYVNLLDTLAHNVRLLEKQGMATKANVLSVEVKLNSAQVDLTKVDNGLVLSRMALAQVCGLPVNSELNPVDSESSNIEADSAPINVDVNEAWQNRSDLRALEIGIKAAEQQKKVAMSSMLPTVALVGAYSFSNPNVYNGFEKKFSGAFSVGAMVSIPLWHWGGNYYKYKAAESEQLQMKLKLEDSRELVDLQVNQAAYRYQESYKTWTMTKSNLASAAENLRTATIGFKEGVVSSDDVMAAQTAWLKANSENVDAQIDIHLCKTYLSKVLGTLN